MLVPMSWTAGATPAKARARACWWLALRSDFVGMRTRRPASLAEPLGWSVANLKVAATAHQTAEWRREQCEAGHRSPAQHKGTWGPGDGIAAGGPVLGRGHPRRDPVAIQRHPLHADSDSAIGRNSGAGKREAVPEDAVGGVCHPCQGDDHVANLPFSWNPATDRKTENDAMIEGLTAPHRHRWHRTASPRFSR